MPGLEPARASSTSSPVVGEPLAHATEGGASLHPLRNHLSEVGRLASGFVSRFSDGRWGEAAGRLHDLGKFAAGFQRMLAEANGFEAHIEGDASGPRDHSSAGALRALELHPDDRGLIVALAIAGHHGGLPSARDLVKRRLPDKSRDRCLERAKEGGAAATDLILPAGLPATLEVCGGPPSRARLEMLVRMIFSCLCDADFLDTERFYAPDQAALRLGWPDLCSLRPRLDGYLEGLASAAPPSEVNRVRAEILAACRSAAASTPGFFSLTVPTGGGKTLASMAFALGHAEAHGLDRVVVAIPFTSIIEQSAEAYRAALGAEAVLEHHSALGLDRDTAASRLAAENWDAPVVVTTTVQLFESLFACRPAACRKLHRLARSVIVLDEVQSLPPGLLAPLLDALGSLVTDLGASVVFCTATQPAFGRDRLSCGLRGIREVVPAEVRAFERLRRVRTRWPATPAPTPWEALADEISAEQDVLAIVHRRRDARDLCELLDARLGAASTFHLSALMCAEHRSRVLAAVREQKRRGMPVRLVATQLVEAGVDLDFAVVYRALGGLDAMAQAAGRCNREGRLPGLGELRVFRAPSRPPMGVPATGLAISAGMLEAEPGLDLFSSAVHQRYFTQLYGVRDLDAKEIQRLRGDLDYPEVAARFKLIEDAWSAPVVVPYAAASEYLSALERAPSRASLRRLQRLTVTVSSKDRDAWIRGGSAVERAGLVVSLANPACYHQRFGLLLDRAGDVAPESLIA